MNPKRKQATTIIGIATLMAGMGLMSQQLFAATVEMMYVDSADGVVTNAYGECWQSLGPVDARVECGGVIVDSDGDGVPDGKDQCPDTPAGVEVDAVGCPIGMDSDGDGVLDSSDKCPGTPAGARVNADGCDIAEGVVISAGAGGFAFDKAVLTSGVKAVLDRVIAAVKRSLGDESLTITGHTDNMGTEAYNQGLSTRRAQAAADYMAGNGINSARMTVQGKGETQPVADNETEKGRAVNRRVEIQTN